MKRFKGEVKARIIDARFALSGRIVSVNKLAGDIVKKGNLIASLDRKILQAELDKELADFEKVRADFEIFNQKNPNPESPIDKYLKTEKQAALNASVKEVELAKAKLDQCDLFSPVDGIVIDDSGIVSGLNITPASASFKIVDASSYCFEIKIEQKDILLFESPKHGKIKIIGLKEELKGEVSPVYPDGKSLFVKIPLTNVPGIMPGLKGEVIISN